MRTIEGPQCTKQHAHDSKCQGGSKPGSKSGSGSGSGSGGSTPSSEATQSADARSSGASQGTSGEPGSGEPTSTGPSSAGKGPIQTSPTASEGPVPTSEQRSEAAGSGAGDPLAKGTRNAPPPLATGGDSRPVLIEITTTGPATRSKDREAQVATRRASTAASAENLRRPTGGEAAEADVWQPLPARLADLVPHPDAPSSPPPSSP